MVAKTESAGNEPVKTTSWLRHVAFSLTSLLLALMLTNVLLYELVIVRWGSDTTERLSMLYARHYLALTNDAIRTTQQELDELNRPEFIKGLQAGDLSAVNQMCNQILVDNPKLHHFAVLPLNYASMGLAVDLPFSTQDMVNRIFEGKNAPPEISYVQGRRLLNLVLPLRDSGQVIGALTASFDMPEFAGEFREFVANDGYVVLREAVQGNQSVVAMSAGNASWASPNAIHLPTRSANLVLEFSPGPGLEVPSAFTRIFLIVLAGQSCIIFMVLGLIFWRWKKQLQADVSTLLIQVDGQLNGAATSYGLAGLPPMAEMAEKIRHLFKQSNIAIKLGSASRHVLGSAQEIAEKVSMSEQDSLLLARDASHRREQVLEIPPPVVPVVESTRMEVVEASPQSSVAVDSSIFRAYDIRGVVGTQLTAEVVALIGQAIGSEAIARKQSSVIVARDGRLSGPELIESLITGLRQSGVNVIDVGRVPTPVLYFATKTLGSESGVMLTGSHNPPNYNGLKIVLAGETLAGDAITALYQRIVKGDLRQGQGQLQQRTINKAYIDCINADVALARPLKLVIDAGNGITGDIAPKLFTSLGCEVIPLFCEVDGNFPNHHPDPSKPENLHDLIEAVATHQADLGLAFDGDGDRVGVVTPAGKSIFADRLMMLFAKHVLISHPGADIIFDVKCTRDLRSLIAEHGGRPVMSRTGHSYIKAKLKETGAALAGEMSGHIFFNDRWFGFDDGMYSGARLLEILSLDMTGADALFAEFPENVSTPEINIPVSDAEKFAVVERLKAAADFATGSVSTLDGLRVDFPQSWGLIRASNTTPVLVARFEGRTQEDLDKVKAQFRALLERVAPDIHAAF